MSGIKENQEIRQVRLVNTMSERSISISDSEALTIPTVIESAAKVALVIMAPHLIKAAFKGIEKIAATTTVKDVQRIATEATRKTISTVSFSTVQSAKEVATLVGKIKTAGSVTEIKEACDRIQTICVQEQMPSFKTAIATTVKTVMVEVGFTNITVKTINSTPVIIAKNAKGQTIKTEVTEDSDHKIDLVRIQSAIPESECDALNEKINSAFKKHGLDYARFSKVGKVSTTNRSLDFSEEHTNVKNNQNIHLKH